MNQHCAARARLQHACLFFSPAKLRNFRKESTPAALLPGKGERPAARHGSYSGLNLKEDKGLTPNTTT